MTEHQLQNQILDWLNKHPNYFAWRNQSQGQFRDGKWCKKVGFDIKGCSDILAIRSPCGTFYAIEVKSEKGKATMEQNAFINKINKMGGKAICVWSLDMVVDFVK